MTTDHFTVRRADTAIQVSRGGHGRPLVFCPGLTSTQTELRELLDLLRRDFDVVSLDLRGHGFSPAARYDFGSFLDDFAAVMTAVGPLDSPVLAGHSYGADLIVHYAAENPGAVGELIVIDGANPIPAPFLTAADLPELRAVWQEQARWLETTRGTGRQVLLTPQEILDLNVELDILRCGIDLDGPGILDRYRAIDCPIQLIMSTTMAGVEGRAARHNRLWRAGVERLVREQPRVSVTWVDATHALVLTHAAEIAGLIRRIR
ncbi:alpha/beta fold hydrolase [Nocardia sp. NPDC127579]|uniref:alpha/beta fold hydrolase n=1 Tax=Nocardia sp. NPDC127579 TaxID=3345402 RepID=UPI003638B200